MKQSTSYTPRYFMALSHAYHSYANNAERFENPKIVVEQLRMAAIQFSYATHAIENAKKLKDKIILWLYEWHGLHVCERDVTTGKMWHCSEHLPTQIKKV